MRAGLSSLVDHEIRVLLITGQRISISARGIWHMFFGLDSAVFFGASFGLVAFLFPVPADIDIPWWMKLSGFSIFLVLLPVVYFLQILAISTASIYVLGIYIFEPLLLLFSAFAIELVDHNISPLLFGEQWALWLETASFAHQVIATFILLLANDVLFCYFVLPRRNPPGNWDSGFPTAVSAGGAVPQVLAAERASPHQPGQEAGPGAPASVQTRDMPPATEPVSFVELGGQKVSVASILAVEAEEHYVRVWSDDREIFARQSFGGLISQIDKAEGFSPRRGIWLSFRNIDEVQKAENGKFMIVPFKGPLTIVPKAKVRNLRRFLTDTSPSPRRQSRNHG